MEGVDAAVSFRTDELPDPLLDLGELMCIDALQREESAGGHFRVEYQEGGEAKRNDDDFLYVSAWQYTGEQSAPVLNKEPLVYEEAKLATRSYK